MSRFYFFLWLSWLITISFLLLMPGKHLPEADLQIPHLDKYLHFVMFAMLSFLFLLFRKSKVDSIENKEKFAIILLFSAFGIMTEFVQEFFIEGRYFDIWDVVANALGTIAGAMLLFCIKK